jgi:hypothetical protein
LLNGIGCLLGGASNNGVKPLVDELLNGNGWLLDGALLEGAKFKFSLLRSKKLIGGFAQ